MSDEIISDVSEIIRGISPTMKEGNVSKIAAEIVRYFADDNIGYGVHIAGNNAPIQTVSAFGLRIDVDANGNAVDIVGEFGQRMMFNDFGDTPQQSGPINPNGLLH